MGNLQKFVFIVEEFSGIVAQGNYYIASAITILLISRYIQ